MQDPVIISTGQTYDRTLISEWQRKENFCPKTRQSLINTRLVPNRALRSLISKWCIACGIPSGFIPTETLFTVSSTSAVIEVNKATGNLLIKFLSSELIGVNIFAAHELHLLAKSGKENQAYIAEAGAIPLLQKLLLSHHPVAQEKSVKAILFLSMHENNKILIMEQVAESIVHVLINGQTDEARVDAASTLSCLCAIHDYRARIAGIEGTVNPLLRLLKRGGRAKITAINTLVLMADHVNNCSKLIEAGCLKYLAEALDNEELTEHAAAVFISLIQHPVGAEVIQDDHTSIVALLVLTRHYWFPRVMNNAIVALKELFPDVVAPAMIVGGLAAS